MEPGKSFLGIRDYMDQLPSDYCILFQDGFDEVKPGTMFAKSNYIFAIGVPVLTEINTYFKNSDKIKQIAFKDLVNCSNRHDAIKLLECSFAKEELKKHLSNKYGAIESMYINDSDLNLVMKKVDLLINKPPELDIVSEDLSITTAIDSKTTGQVESDAESIESLLSIHTNNFREVKTVLQSSDDDD